MSHLLKVARATLASTARGWQGLFAQPAAVTPQVNLKLYDMEGCPFCRLVREVLTELHLNAEIYPCPKNGTRYRQEAKAIAGKEQFPLLVDPNTGRQLQESAEIIEYLYATYGQRPVPLRHRLRPAQVASSFLNSAIGGQGGIYARPSKMAAKPLRLFSFEASPFCRPVREMLCELELAYELINLGKEQWADMGAMGMHLTVGEYAPVEGGKRASFMNKTNRMMVPYLEDPNTGKSMFESERIVEYLLETYGD